MDFNSLRTKNGSAAETLLIVDDDVINRGILENIFLPFYTIEEAENGRVGLEKILAEPDRLCAILLDVVMPEMDGIEVLKHLLEQDLLNKIPVFLITAEASDSTMKEAYQMGVMDVISKPVVPYVVQRRVNSVVELFRARKRLGNGPSRSIRTPSWGMRPSCVNPSRWVLWRWPVLPAPLLQTTCRITVCSTCPICSPRLKRWMLSWTVRLVQNWRPWPTMPT